MNPLRRRTAALAVATLAALTLAACGPSDPDGPGTPSPEETGSPDETDDGAFPVTIQHAFGETVVEERPERVVTWGWATADAVIALGVTPVAMPFQAYAGDEEGVLPWIREALEDRGDEIPTVLTDTGQDVPFEEISTAQPDLILAHYSGITEEQYETLSGIAPVVPYPDEPWATPWRDVVTIAGTALGLEDEADRVLAGIDDQLAAAREAHPEFEGVTLAATLAVSDTFYVYTEADPRVEFMLDLGFENAPSVDELDTGEATFYFVLSNERLDELTSDVLVVYAADEEEMQAFLDSPSTQAMSQVQEGRVAQVVGVELVSAVSPPSALSLPWGLDDVVAALAEAVAAGS